MKKKKTNNPCLNGFHSPQSQEGALVTFDFSKETISNEPVERVLLAHFLLKEWWYQLLLLYNKLL